ncbi:hypothetical protein [Sorangium sp. So ce117]|uniref:hypothetical protein n=1 Tax=Sorangium sp. So ce117 TaxID=3133277 RepID=UPI003F63209C
MDAAFVALASEMRLPDHEQTDPARAVAVVRSRLGRRGQWLLLFDDVRAPSEVDPYIPSVSQGGHILMTSQNPIWRGLTTITVRGIERAESVSFLLRRTGETDAEAADALAEELGELLTLRNALARPIRLVVASRRGGSRTRGDEHPGAGDEDEDERDGATDLRQRHHGATSRGYLGPSGERAHKPGRRHRPARLRTHRLGFPHSPRLFGRCARVSVR